MKWLVLLFALFTLVLSSPTEAAKFRTGSEAGLRWISIDGEIVANDDTTFLDIAADQDHVAVLLTSPGGLVTVGVKIGEVIHKRGYATVVPPDAVCASVCGAIWLGGTQRFVGEDAKVGFHAAYTATGDAVEVSPVANAWLGAYFGNIGLNQQTIGFLVEAGPRDMKWLNPREARENNIAYVFMSRHGSRFGALPGQSVGVPASSGEEITVRKEAAAPALSIEEGRSAERLTRRFNARFKEGGISAVDESIDVCYQTVIENRKWDSGVYCAALDVLTMMVDSKLAEVAKLPPTARNDRPAVVRRSNRVAATLGFDAELLRERGSLVAAVALSKVDTTEDPQATVEVSASSDVVVEHRSSSAPARGRAPASGCATFAAQVGQVDSALQSIVNSLFCGGRR